MLELKKPITLKTPVGFVYFDYEEIIAIEANRNCSLIHLSSGMEKIRVLHNLSYIEQKLCNKHLFRCHKSYIINPLCIKYLYIKTHEVVMSNGITIPLSEAGFKYLRESSNANL